jgi:hypothetical protein
MVSLAHSFAGATIACAFPNPTIYIPLALLSHYILDAIPHYDLGSTIKNYEKNKKTSLILAFIDVSIAFITIVIFGYLTHKNLNFYLGAFLGILPDIIDAPTNFFNKKYKLLIFFNKIHGKYHHNSKNVFNGIFPQVIVIIIAILLMVKN